MCARIQFCLLRKKMNQIDKKIVSSITEMKTFSGRTNVITNLLKNSEFLSD